MYPPSLLLVPNVNVSLICFLRESEFGVVLSIRARSISSPKGILLEVRAKGVYHHKPPT